MDNYYSILGVDENASNDVIKKAFRKLSMKHHPDRGGNADTFKNIAEANELIKSFLLFLITKALL